MKMTLEVPFQCPENIRPHLEKVFQGEYEPAIGLNGQYRIIDLGANFGAFSLWAAHHWPGSTIHAFEPHPDTYLALCENTRPYPNIITHDWGIGAPGLRVLHDGLNNPGENSFHQQMCNPNFTGRHLEVKDPLTLPEADIIKLDIEGCEVEVLRPLIEAGRKFDLVLMEYHNEGLRREVDAILSDYALIGSEVQHIAGRGVVKYLHHSLHERLFV